MSDINVGSNFLPNENNTYYLGNSTKKWKIDASQLTGTLPSHTHNNYMLKNNAVGTGTFSHNRLSADSPGMYSATLGNNNSASGAASVAIGNTNTASGNWGAIAEGSETLAKGEMSHSEGFKTIAAGSCQHVQGKWNIESPDFAHIVGNGTDDNNRSNAHTIDWSGNAWYAGLVKGKTLQVANENHEISVNENNNFNFNNNVDIPNQQLTAKSVVATGYFRQQSNSTLDRNNINAADGNHYNPVALAVFDSNGWMYKKDISQLKYAGKSVMIYEREYGLTGDTKFNYSATDGIQWYAGINTASIDPFGMMGTVLSTKENNGNALDGSLSNTGQVKLIFPGTYKIELWHTCTNTTSPKSTIGVGVRDATATTSYCESFIGVGTNLNWIATAYCQYMTTITEPTVYTLMKYVTDALPELPSAQFTKAIITYLG